MSHFWNSFLTLIPLQQLKGPSQNNSKVFLLSLSVICCIPWVTQLKSWIKYRLHLNTFNQFQIRFKTRLTTKNNAETICHLFSRRRHSHNHRVQNVSFIGLKCVFLCYWVDCLSLNTNKCMFWKLNNRFWRCSSVLPQRPQGTCRKLSLTYSIKQWNAGCKTLNNDHYDCTYYQRLSAFMSFSLMIDYMYLKFLSKAIFKRGIR